MPAAELGNQGRFLAMREIVVALLVGAAVLIFGPAVEAARHHCPRGAYWVEGHHTPNGTRIHAHCRFSPPKEDVLVR